MRLKGTRRSFRPFPRTLTVRLARLTSLDVEPDELAQAQPRGVEELEDRPIPAAERTRDVGHFQQPRTSRPHRDGPADADPAGACRPALPDRRPVPLPAGDTRPKARIAASLRAADDRELPRLWRSLEEARMCPWVESAGTRSARACRGAGRRNVRNCDEVAFVGAHGMRRGIVVERRCSRNASSCSFTAADIQRKVGQPQRTCAASTASTSRTTRRELERAIRYASFRSLLFRHTSAAAGGQRRHDAERDVGRLVVRRIGVRHVEAERADRGLRGGGAGGCPRTSAAAFRPAISPDAADST